MPTIFVAVLTAPDVPTTNRQSASSMAARAADMAPRGSGSSKSTTAGRSSGRWQLGQGGTVPGSGIVRSSKG